MDSNSRGATEIYYDPYDFEIDSDPYPIWKRMRNEAPLYYNEKHDFYALSRYEDVKKCLKDHETYISGKGTVMELIKAEFQAPPGMIIFEDPPIHDIHRNLLRKVFTPASIDELEPHVRNFCAAALDPFVETGRFDFIHDLGAEMPMRVIGMLLGIPDSDQAGLRDQLNSNMTLTEEGKPKEEFFGNKREIDPYEIFANYLDWRTQNQSDDLMTKLLTIEFEDIDGQTRTLRRDEILGIVNLVAAAGNETTTRLIGWTGKVLSEHPEQLKEIIDDPSLIRNAIEEVLRFETPSPVQARYVAKDVEHYGKIVPQGSVILLINGSANRDERKYDNPDVFDIHRKPDHMTFGQGIHFCLGSHLAKLEGRIALEEVIKRFRSWKVDWTKAKQARTSTVRGWESLPVIADSRNS